MDQGELKMCSTDKNKVSGEGEVKRAYDMSVWEWWEPTPLGMSSQLAIMPFTAWHHILWVGS